MAPFLAQRIWNRPAFPVRLVECQECGFAFFNPRLEREEEQRLYHGYRDGTYQRQRRACEPWYTEQFNRRLSAEPALYKRKVRLGQILRELSGDRPVRRVLDFGGASGELVRNLIPGAEAFVYDISKVEPAPGIHPLHSLVEGRSLQFDLIVCSNVLEHVAYPRELVNELEQAASPGSLVFIEVPCESPSGLSNFAKRMAQEIILFGTHPAIAFTLLRSSTTTAMHEHVSFFRPSVLERLLTGPQWKVLAKGTYKLGPRLFGGEMAWCLAERLQSPE
jgi:SAM-dependent methyltransferase